MKAAKSWCVAGLVMAAAWTSASCGKDEASGNGPGMIVGGSAGATGGTAMGRAGSMGNTGGSAGSGLPTFGTSKLGRGCLDDQDCEDAVPGLTCIRATDDALDGGAPPKGLCTAPCAEDAECVAFSSGALCYPFGRDSYCVEGCAFGEPGVGEQKCHDRDEFACNPALLADTGDACTTNSQCGVGEICIAADPDDAGAGRVCAVVFPACLPACRGDIDCAEGMFCDQSFLSGVCVSEKPTGKALGEACTVKAEPDDCLGFCQADATGSTDGHCAQTCALGVQCAWNSSSSLFDGVCLYASVLTQDTGSVGDFGFCTPSCNCTAECGDPELGCSVESTLGALNDTFRGPGLCFTADDTIPELDQCAAGGAGGAGGAGISGAPTNESGAPGTPAAGGVGGN